MSNSKNYNWDRFQICGDAARGLFIVDRAGTLPRLISENDDRNALQSVCELLNEGARSRLPSVLAKPALREQEVALALSRLEALVTESTASTHEDDSLATLRSEMQIVASNARIARLTSIYLFTEQWSQRLEELTQSSSDAYGAELGLETTNSKLSAQSPADSIDKLVGNIRHAAEASRRNGLDFNHILSLWAHRLERLTLSKMNGDLARDSTSESPQSGR
jgi:hypothetical protein